MRTLVSLLVVFIVAIVADLRLSAGENGTWLPEREQVKLRSMWPTGVEIPTDILFYSGTVWSQYVVIRNESDYHEWVERNKDVLSDQKNPNKLHPWKESGGLENARGWKSYKARSMPLGRIKVFTEKVYARAGRDLPKISWSYPNGTAFFDMLSKDGKVFELRRRKKVNGEWKVSVLFSSKEDRPAGYNGRLGRSCSSCHDAAGTFQGYGVWPRGGDTVFTFNPVFMQEPVKKVVNPLSKGWKKP